MKRILINATHREELRVPIRNGRREFLTQFPSALDSDVQSAIPHPDDGATFDPAAPEALVAEMERERPGAPLNFMIGLSASAVAAELRADREFSQQRE